VATYSGGFRSAGAGSTTLPTASLYATATCAPRLLEVAAFNTTTTAVVLALRFLTTTGTQGTGRDESNWDSSQQNAATCTLFDTHTVAPTITAGNLVLLPLGAAVGSGVLRSFKDRGGITIPKGTGNGIGLVVLTGTGQICDVDFTWAE
jgi:hypothetical protein